jgi:hypothetical protein
VKVRDYRKSGIRTCFFQRPSDSIAWAAQLRFDVSDANRPEAYRHAS